MDREDDVKGWVRDKKRKPCWTNWTFGVWYAKPPQLRRETFGIDLGPWAWVWTRR